MNKMDRITQRDMREIWKRIFGNGDPGLLKVVAKIEGQVNLILAGIGILIGGLGTVLWFLVRLIGKVNGDI